MAFNISPKKHYGKNKIFITIYPFKEGSISINDNEGKKYLFFS